MKETGKRKASANVQSKRSGITERRNNKPHQENGGKTLNVIETKSKARKARPHNSHIVSDQNVGSEPSKVYENVVIHSVDDVNRSEEIMQDSIGNDITNKMNMDENIDDCSVDLDGETSHGKEGESDSETIKDSISSQGDSLTTEDEKEDKAPKELAKSNGGTPKEATVCSLEKNSETMIISPKSSLEYLDDNHAEEFKEIDLLDETSNDTQSIGSDNEPVDAEDETALKGKIEEMEARIEKLEAELREVAALEISLYSVAPEHGSSAHKVHTPARRLSRLYIHACKHWTQNKRATVARNTVSGLILIAKSCGNDVSRLTFWLSNTIVLREIICQAFGNSRNSGLLTPSPESNGSNRRSEVRSTTVKWKAGAGNKQLNGSVQLVDDWQETGTFTSALEKVESWIFSRIVESVWWQALTPYMQAPLEGLSFSQKIGTLLGPTLGDHQQGNYSINLWKNAFQEAFQRICPVRAGGHECGCLPIIARMVMEQCIARLDVAMFNAILRESAHEIPTDPVSDPIVDSKVLPIPAGDLSFGSGAQLKNSVGNWSRWLTDMFGMDADEEQHNGNEFRQNGNEEAKSFHLLNALSDLLMLPKDMLMDSSIRKEVCPSISLPLVKRILCNFTPDEFCPDPVPGAVLEVLNAESIIERRLSGDTYRSFPYTAAPVVYTPSSGDIAEKAAEAGVKLQLSWNASVVQRKGYTSDEELEELDSPLTYMVTAATNDQVNGKHEHEHEHEGHGAANARYELLREVWSS